jgi:hypothetical protein
MRCPSCASDLAVASPFCPSCGLPTESFSQLATSPGVIAYGVNRLSSESIPVGGMTPGAMLGGRYRIVGLLGRGGMGEVYRADDIKLGQAVALKFLPRPMSVDAVWRERFFAEVRLARQVAHPNVCRVYDIGDVDGRHFLSMEYIDGEDLASLLKRVGSLSNEKALDVARQLAAGLAAAHAAGVLHRDLKPANIMIDGHGRARITDFGLAVASTSAPVAGEVAGTPAYMAPEQLAGGGATVRTDIYGLGLVLYEACCGRPAFTARTLVELRDQKEHTAPRPPSEIRPGIDPVAERVILRCLERDPRARPASVAQVAASLPGGDPLAAALAAGETPSPELVAASGLKEGLPPAVAVALLAVVAAGSLATVWLNERTSIVAQARPSRSSEAMVERARTVLSKAGYADAAAYSTSSFYVDNDVVSYVNSTSDGAARATGFRALGAVGFSYRQSAASFVGQGDVTSGSVDPGSPLREEGDIEIRLDAEGRLRSFAAMPVVTAAPVGGPDWPAVLREAGLDPSEWMPVSPAKRPRFFVDTRLAWEGRLPGSPETPARVEATALDGRMVTFDIVGPWHSAASAGGPTAGAAGTPARRFTRALDWVVVPINAVVFLAAAFFARQNLRIGRGDRRGATRLAVFGSAVTMTAWALTGRGVVALYTALGYTLGLASFVWVFYVAVEPFVRRRWPAMLVSWVRVLAGDMQDPLVGRDVLIGCATGVIAACLTALNRMVGWQAGNANAVLLPDWFMFNGTGPFIGAVLAQFATGLFVSLLMLFLLFLFRVVGRSDWIALPLFAVVAGFSRLSGAAGALWATVPLLAAGGALRTFTLVRVGLVAAIVDAFVWTLFSTSPMTLQPSAWYASAGYVSLGIVGAMAIYGFRTALASRSRSLLSPEA